MIRGWSYLAVSGRVLSSIFNEFAATSGNPSWITAVTFTALGAASKLPS